MFVGWQVIASCGHALPVTLILVQPPVSQSIGHRSSWIGWIVGLKWKQWKDSVLLITIDNEDTVYKIPVLFYETKAASYLLIN